MAPLPAFVDSAQRLRAMRAAWQPTVASLRRMPHFAGAYAAIDRLLADPAHGLTLLGGGSGSAYGLSSGSGDPLWVVKPGDEDARGPNCKGDTYTGPDGPLMRPRPAVPLVTAPQRELASSLVAHALGLDHVVTEVVVMPVDFTGHPHHALGVKDPVKLCSVARFVPGSVHAADLWPHRDMLENANFEPDSLAENMLLNWAIYDTDAHGRNTLVTVAGDSGLAMAAWMQLPRQEQKQYRLQLTRIDTGLAMPEENLGLRNDLATDSSARQPMSDALRKRFLARATEPQLRRTARKLDALGLYPDGVSHASNAFITRMRLLRGWLESEPSITLAEINDRFMAAEGAGRAPTA